MRHSKSRDREFGLFLLRRVARFLCFRLLLVVDDEAIDLEPADREPVDACAPDREAVDRQRSDRDGADREGAKRDRAGRADLHRAARYDRVVETRAERRKIEMRPWEIEMP